MVHMIWTTFLVRRCAFKMHFKRQYMWVAKIQQNGCDRDRSRAWILSQMVKCNVYFFPLKCCILASVTSDLQSILLQTVTVPKKENRFWHFGHVDDIVGICRQFSERKFGREHVLVRHHCPMEQEILHVQKHTYAWLVCLRSRCYIQQACWDSVKGFLVQIVPSTTIELLVSC